MIIFASSSAVSHSLHTLHCEQSQLNLFTISHFNLGSIHFPCQCLLQVEHYRVSFVSVTPAARLLQFWHLVMLSLMIRPGGFFAEMDNFDPWKPDELIWVLFYGTFSAGRPGSTFPIELRMHFMTFLNSDVGSTMPAIIVWLHLTQKITGL